MFAKTRVDEKQVNALELTISLTMTVKEWREVCEILPEGWPGWKVAELIQKSVNEVTTAVNRHVSTEPPNA